jgi:predicted secreted Zn-dependent protease
VLLLSATLPAGAVAQLGAGARPDSLPHPGVRVDASEEHYPVGEVTLSEVIARLNRTRLLGPQGPLSQGLTSYHVRPEWSTAVRPGSCRVATLTLHVRIVVTLPRWEARDAAPEPHRARWARILGAIRDHEHTHRDLVLDAAERLHETLTALEAGTCATLGRAFDATLAIADAELKEAHRALDEATPARIVGELAGASLAARGRNAAARVGDATAPDPRRRDDA